MRKNTSKLLIALLFSSLTLTLNASAQSGFEAIDANEDGSLSIEEYGDAILNKKLVEWEAKGMSKEKIEQSTAKLRAMAKLSFESFDKNKDNKVSKAEIIAYNQGKSMESGQATQAAATYDFPDNAQGFQRNQFKRYDVNKDGHLNLEEYTNFLTPWLTKNMPEKDPVAHAPNPFKQKDTNQDGMLSPRELF
ncbi:MAG: EF-hand domain-containing protein [Opitutaceae bacterium]